MWRWSTLPARQCPLDDGMVAAVNVAVVNDMPLAVGMEEAEIVAAESDVKADVEPSVDSETDDEATDVELLRSRTL